MKWPTFEQMIAVAGGFAVLVGLYNLLVKLIDSNVRGKSRIEKLEKENEEKETRLKALEKENAYLSKRWEIIETRILNKTSL